jgi:hypothetical protein
MTTDSGDEMHQQDAVHLPRQPSHQTAHEQSEGSVSTAGHVQPGLFEEALGAVSAMSEIRTQIAEDRALSAESSFVEEVLLAREAEGKQLILPDLPPREPSRIAERPMLRAGSLRHRLPPDGGGRLGGSADSVGFDSVAFDSVGADGELGGGDGYNGPTAPLLSDKVCPSAIAIGDAAAASVGVAEAPPPRPPRCDAGYAARRAGSRLARAMAKRLRRELGLLAMLLLPLVLAIHGNGEDSGWRLALGRPAYALLLARGCCALAGRVLASPCVTDALPPSAMAVGNALAGWRAVCLVWVGAMGLATVVPSRDDAAWRELFVRYECLQGVALWLAAGAASRALLELVSAGMFSKLQRGQYEERVRRELLSLKVLRLVFASARASVKRARARLGADGHRRHHGATAAGGLNRQVEPEPASSNTVASRARRARIDAQLFAAGDLNEDDVGGPDSGHGLLSGSLALLRSALEQPNGFVSSLAHARRQGARAFRALRAEVLAASAERSAGELSTVGGADGAAASPTIPREWLLDVLRQALCRSSAQLRAEMEVAARALFPQEHLAEPDFVSAAERAYKEQSYLGASVDASGALHAHVHALVVGFWAALWGVLGLFLVDWGVDLSRWVMPFSSTVLSSALVLGWLPYETFSGILYVLLVRAYDIGDKIVLVEPGRPVGACEALVVSEIHLTCTRVICWNGEQHTMMNHIVRARCRRATRDARSRAVPTEPRAFLASHPHRCAPLRIRPDPPARRDQPAPVVAADRRAQVGAARDDRAGQDRRARRRGARLRRERAARLDARRGRADQRAQLPRRLP